MSSLDDWFKKAGTDVFDIVKAPSNLLNSISNSLNSSPILLYGLIGIGGLIAYKIVLK